MFARVLWVVARALYYIGCPMLVARMDGWMDGCHTVSKKKAYILRKDRQINIL